MIQDIAPHKYDNCYREQEPQGSDFVLYIKDSKALLLPTEAENSVSEAHAEGYRIPTMEELEKVFPKAKACAVYLFSIDEKAYFLIEYPWDTPAAVGENADTAVHGSELYSFTKWQNTQYFRVMEPKHQAFAAITAMQLWRWRRSRSFCGCCGSPTQHSGTERAFICPKCGQIEYPKISPAVIVAITNGDKLLMSRYRDRPYGGYALIAGFVEIGESFEEAVHREVLEEVGLRVKNVRYYKSQPWAFTDTEMIGFFAELDGDDTIHLQEDELSEAGWYKKDEIADDLTAISVGSEMKMVFKYDRSL